jgi:hypothetical protein
VEGFATLRLGDVELHGSRAHNLTLTPRNPNVHHSQVTSASTGKFQKPKMDKKSPSTWVTCSARDTECLSAFVRSIAQLIIDRDGRGKSPGLAKLSCRQAKRNQASKQATGNCKLRLHAFLAGARMSHGAAAERRSETTRQSQFTSRDLPVGCVLRQSNKHRRCLFLPSLLCAGAIGGV